MQAPADTYLDDKTYAALRAELAHLIALPLVHDADTEVVRILGEVGGIWPQSVMDDANNTENTPVSSDGVFLAL
ncbi:hypothetical protein [Thalassovita aquimarina]|uniref:Uncharacterized protein n=1 Tax=Thalassovita aquimarina TaxID=2785917 RepID=A0ABS5HT04_9RHOB|nr:hypothetical protein [Thalassovita aquimarina]MBR9651673.1 hypothetical protein [Thalassovita aquimarina]